VNCNNPWLTAALNSVGRGSAADKGNSGLCNIDRYRAGSWNSQAQLNDLVKQAFLCNDPWIGQVYAEQGYSKPNGSGSSGECNPGNYGGGSWSSYADLRAKVKAYKTGPTPAPTPQAGDATARCIASGRCSAYFGQWGRSTDRATAGTSMSTRQAARRADDSDSIREEERLTINTDGTYDFQMTIAMPRGSMGGGMPNRGQNIHGSWSSPDGVRIQLGGFFQQYGAANVEGNSLVFANGVVYRR